MRPKFTGWFVFALALGALVSLPALHAQQSAGQQTGPQLGAQKAAPTPEEIAKAAELEADKKIVAEVKDHNELEKNEEHLADEIGPRLTGSENLDKASHWTEQQFKNYGLENVHLEPWTVAHTWSRGPISGKIVSPVEHNMTLAAVAWTAGTNGPVRAPAVYVKLEKPEDLDQYKGKLKGAFVIFAAPHEFEPPPNPALVPLGDPIVPLNIPKITTPQPQGPQMYRLMRTLFTFLPQEGVAGVILSSDKKYQQLNMLSFGGPMYNENPIPAAVVSWEDYNLIWRLMQKGPVNLELNIQNTFGEKPATVYNTVAEIKGSEKPDEVVVIGGHLDSWDLGTGATDNGTGSMAVLEAARALRASGVKPKRTIRFILFTGEEQGLVGSQHYVDEHKADLPKISAALVHDTGTGKVESIGLMGNYQDRETMDAVLEPLHAMGMGLLESSLAEMGGSDHASFDHAGVPGFWVIQDPMDYNMTHHSQADTFDRVNFDDLAQGAEVLGVWAYNVADLPNLMPRKPTAATPPIPVPAPPAQGPPPIAPNVGIPKPN